MITVPRFELLKRQPNPPHVARVVAECLVENEHGAHILFRVRESRKGDEWWLSASLNEMRMSNTLHTRVARKAKEWIQAVKRGQIRVEGEAPLPPCARELHCLCAGHARGNDPTSPCDTSETVPTGGEMIIAITVKNDTVREVVGGAGCDYWCDFRDDRHAWDRDKMQLTVVEVGDKKPKVHTVGPKDFERAVGIMAEKFPQQFAAIMEENYDRVTGDLLVQLAIFGEDKYS